MLGAANALADKLGPGTTVNAKEGRQATEYPAVIDRYRKIGRAAEPRRDPGRQQRARLLRRPRRDPRRAPGVADVYLVNVEVPRSWEGEVNDELEDFAAGWPEAKLSTGTTPSSPA